MRALARRLAQHAREHAFDLQDPPRWASGVYGLIDAVFRARAEYATTVLPLLQERLPERPGMRDRPRLRFQDFLADVAALRGPEGYARKVLNRQRIGARRKVAVCCDAAAFFSRRGLETKAKLRALPSEERERVVCELLPEIEGIGPTIARQLLVQLEHAEPPRPDRWVRGLLAGLGPWTPDPRSPEDDERAAAILTDAAARLRVTPALLDLQIHRAASAGSRGEGARMP